MTSDQRPFLNWEDLEYILRKESPEEWSIRLQEASSNKFNLIKVMLCRFATDSQIRALFEKLTIKDTSNNVFKKLLANKAGNNSILSWKQKLIDRTPSLFSQQSNYILNELQWEDHKLLYYKTTNKSNNKTRTLIGFAGDAGMLMAPTSCILSILSPFQYDLILIRRLYKGTYFEGKGRLLSSIHKHLEAILGDNLDHSIMLGTSSGGLPAAYTAHAWNLPLSISLGAIANEKMFIPTGSFYNTKQEIRLQRNPNHPAPKTTNQILIAAGNHTEDRQSANLICRYFRENHPDSTCVKVLLLKGCSDHHIPTDLALKGSSLEEVLTKLLNGNLNGLTHCLE